MVNGVVLVLNDTPKKQESHFNERTLIFLQVCFSLRFYCGFLIKNSQRPEKGKKKKSSMFISKILFLLSFPNNPVDVEADYKAKWFKVDYLQPFS